MTRRSRGEGSVWQRPDGRWVAAIPAGVSPTGKRVYRYFRSEREARAGLRAMLREAETGRIARPGHLTLRDLAHEFLDAAETARRSPNTLKQYRQHLDLRILPKLGGLRLRELRPAHVQRLLASLLRTGRRRRTLAPDAPEGLSPTTVWGVHRLLRTLARFAVRRGYLALPFTEGVVAPRPDEPDRPVLDEAALRHLLETADAAGDPYAPLWRLLVDTGARIGEASGLRWADLFLAPPLGAAEGWRPSVRILRRLEGVDAGGRPVFAPTKSRSSRTLSITRDTAAALEAHRKAAMAAGRMNPFGLVFVTAAGRPLSRGVVHYRLKVALRRAGLPRVSVHGLRHAIATALLRRRVPTEVVSRRLGHANESVTLRVYSHVTQTAEGLAAEEVDRILGGQPETPPAPVSGTDGGTPVR